MRQWDDLYDWSVAIYRMCECYNEPYRPFVNKHSIEECFKNSPQALENSDYNYPVYFFTTLTLHFIFNSRSKERIMAEKDNPNAEHHKRYRELVRQCEAHPMLHEFVRNIPGKEYKNFENEAFVLANAYTLECVNMMNALDHMDNVWDMIILSAENLLAQLDVMAEDAAAKKAE